MASTSIKVQVKSINDNYYIGIVPRSRNYQSDTELIAAVSASPSRKEVSPSSLIQSIRFDGLTPDTNYIIVAYPKAGGEVVRYYTRTYIDLTPGSRGILWAPGVDMNSGFIDVDKQGDLGRWGWDLYTYDVAPGDTPTNDDSGMCWACTAAGMIQWWMNDYKSKTGKDYPVLYADAFHEQSKCYSTQIMDMIIDATGWSDGGSAMTTIAWFFAGLYDHPLYGSPSKAENCNILGAPFRPTYPYWKGGFMGMTWEEAMGYLITTAEASNGYDWYAHEVFYSPNYCVNSGMTQQESAEKFSKLNLEALMEGPTYISFASHAMSCWGAEYEVNNDGKPVITYLYYCENTNGFSSNVKGGLQKGPVTYLKAVFPAHLSDRFTAHCNNFEGGNYPIVKCGGLKGWQIK